MSDTNTRKPILWIVLLALTVVVALGIVYLAPKFMGGGDASSIRANPSASIDLTAADIEASVQTVTLSGSVSPEMFADIKASLVASFCQLNREVWNNQYVAARYLYNDAEGNAYSNVVPTNECPPPQEGERPIIPSTDDIPVASPQEETPIDKSAPADDTVDAEAAPETPADNTAE